MKIKILLSLALLTCLGSTRPNASSTIVGDYVEARTASVFAGACHYNGELVTTGRDAIMAWNTATVTARLRRQWPSLSAQVR